MDLDNMRGHQNICEDIGFVVQHAMLFLQCLYLRVLVQVLAASFPV